MITHRGGLALPVVALVAMLIGVACAGQSARAVDYSATDMSTGRPVSLQSLRGRPAILVSWATWCRECDAELAGLQEFAASSAAAGIGVVAVNIDANDDAEAIDAKIAKHRLTTALWRDRRNEFKRAFGVLGVPSTVVIDATGAVTGVFAGAVDFADDDVLHALDEARAEQP